MLFSRDEKCTSDFVTAICAPLLVFVALSMPIDTWARDSTVSGIPGPQCPTIVGQGAVTQWTPFTNIHVVNYLEYGYHVADVTQFASVFDYPGIGPYPWPGTYNLYAGIDLPLGSYLSASFTVPNSLDLSSLQGQYSIGPLHFSAPVSMSISLSCGDFGQVNPTTVVSNCLVNAATAGESLSWQGAPSDQGCVLVPNYVYYLNVINADISQLPSAGVAISTANATCNAGACFDPIINGPGNWGVADDIFFGPFE